MIGARGPRRSSRGADEGGPMWKICSSARVSRLSKRKEETCFWPAAV